MSLFAIPFLSLATMASATTPQDRERVKGKECGNGVVITHGDGYETQLCHLKQASIIVQKGDQVKKGDILGFVGTSGASEFPHVHFGNVIEHKELVRKGAPSQAIKGDEAIVGWAWFINLRQGDQIRFLLEGPNGVISEITTDPLERKKASYSAFSGKRRTVEVGEYKLNTELLRNNEIIAQSLHVHIVE